MARSFTQEVEQIVQRVRHVEVANSSLADSTKTSNGDLDGHSVRSSMSAVSAALISSSRPREAEALEAVLQKAFESPSFGGLGLQRDSKASQTQHKEILFLVEAWLESLNSQDKAHDYSCFHAQPSKEARPMTLAQKIFAQHALSALPSTGLAAGDVIRVGTDWIIASELSWSAMLRTYQDIGKPGIWRNDRLWIAGDHVAHPTIYEEPKIKQLIKASEFAKDKFKMVNYQGMNYTIMHTEFVRERAEPGQLVLGSDSHTCSAGAVGCLSIGLGTADVMMACALGETWFKIPESILIEFVGRPAPGISGKDVILYILQQLKRNTVAAERIVEFAGEGLAYLSCDARFAICNMCTEFGAVTGVFVPDAITRDYVQRRRIKATKSNSLFFAPDAGAPYAGHFSIDLNKVEPSVAVYPNPDDVVPVSAKAGLQLDGVFIGACTTTEEELVLAALVLKVGLAKGLPLAKGKRHYVPGSLPIVERLRTLGLLDVYESAGFTRGPPGCSYCVGLSAEKADEGETWLSSQNRNFQNRMGKGAVGHVTSAVVCAASAFAMRVTSPVDLLREIDTSFLERYRQSYRATAAGPVVYVQPDLAASRSRGRSDAGHGAMTASGGEAPATIETVQSRVVRLPDFVDTDALAPGSTLTTCTTEAAFGEHVLEHTHPEFRTKVRNGQQVVVAGDAFGVGSSREVAVSALKGAGVQAVIAKSFAFIYQRNQPSLGLLGFTIDDEAFYTAAKEDTDITIDVSARTVSVGGHSFTFALSEIEYNLTVNRGVAESYKRYGSGIWAHMTAAAAVEKEKSGPSLMSLEEDHADKRLEW